MSDRATLVLVHGLAIRRKASAMFRGVETALQARGHKVTRTIVQGDGSLEELSERLWQQLEPLKGPLVLLCHSMGGLQARTLLLDERRAERLEAIATLGSPHRGTALALAAQRFGRAYRDLAPNARRLWNERHSEAEEKSARLHGIRLLSGVAAVSSPRHKLFSATIPLLKRLEGPNDGLVSAQSQRFGAHAFEVPLDHLSCAVLGGQPEEIAPWVELAALATQRR